MDKTTSVKLHSSDYYRYSAPFRQWLYDTRHRQLSDYKTDDAKYIFKKDFVRDWNDRRLPERYYKEGPNMKTHFGKPLIAQTTRRSEENLGFSKDEANRLFDHKVTKARQRTDPVIPEFETEQDRLDHQRRLRTTTKQSDLQFQRRRVEDLEELIPRKEGKAREIEKRREKAAYTRSEKMTEVEFNEDALMTGNLGASRDTDDFETLLMKKRQREQARESERHTRIQERDQDLQAKRERFEEREKQVNAMFKDILLKKKFSGGHGHL